MSGTTFELRCGEVYVAFAPEVLINDNWSSPSSCESATDGTLNCSVNGLGTLTLSRNGALWQTRFTADAPLTFDGFRLRGIGQMPGIESWLSNGFQSWSQSGLIEIGARFSDVATTTALSAQGDLEVVQVVRSSHGGCPTLWRQ